jgi:hypothetical protein
MSVSTVYESNVTTTETLSTGVPAASSARPLLHNGFDTSVTLDSTTTPDETATNYSTATLSGGAATINLASLTDVNGATKDLTGKKVRWLKIKNGGSNSVTVSKGASNGYTGFGASFSMEIKGGGEVTIYCAGNGVAVAAGVRTLDLSGTGTDSFSFAVGAGT